MSDGAPTAVGTIELLTRAADAARDAASAATQGPRIIDEVRGLSRTSWTVECPDADGVISEISCIRYGDAALTAASGPDHWRAVEAAFRRALERHGSIRSGGYTICGTCDIQFVRNGCDALQDLRPLAEQVLRDLGGIE